MAIQLVLVKTTGTGVGWNLSNLTYNSVFKSFTEDTEPTSIVFKDDGTKMYMLGTINDFIYQYSLSTAWDLSTLAYESKSLSLGTQDTNVESMAFKADGTQVYMVGRVTDTVYAYDLSTAWDVSTGSFATGQTKSVVTEDSNPRGITFKPDGTKMYILGDSNNTVYQYTLSTPWNVSTASYDTVSLAFGTELNFPSEMKFKPDGTKLYIDAGDNEVLYQYGLSTAWDLSSGSYDSISQSIPYPDTTPSGKGLAFKTDGTKMYGADAANDKFVEFDL